MGLERLAVIAGCVAEKTAVIEFWRPHDLARIVKAFWIEPVLYFFECSREPRPEHRLVEFRAHQAVAVFAGMRALVFTHHRERLLGDLTHGMHVFLLPQIEDRPHVQAARASMR